MNLKQFISTAIKNLADAIDEINYKFKDDRPFKPVAFMPESIEFDVAVIDEGNGNIKIVELDESETSNTSITRLKFTIESSQYYNYKK